MKFSEICTFAVIYAAYLAARRGKRSRASTAHYEVRLLENIVNLVYMAVSAATTAPAPAGPAPLSLSPPPSL